VTERLKFLNWRPDLEDTENDGLTVAQNVIHDVEGWKPVHLGSAGSFVTTGSLAASVANVTAIITKSVGVGNDTFSAWIANNQLNVGVNGVTSPALTSAGGSLTGYPLSFSTTGAPQITAFDVCEYAGKIFFVAEAAQLEGAPTTTVSIRFMGHLDYD